jgi:hypothetical protein
MTPKECYAVDAFAEYVVVGVGVCDRMLCCMLAVAISQCREKTEILDSTAIPQAHS